MEAEKKAKRKWFRRFFEPEIDFYDLLNSQANKTVEGVEALLDWLREGGEERSEKVRDLERQADDIKMDLERRLVESFITPFDREDIFELSFSLDEVINNSKAIVREIEAFEVTTDGAALVELTQILLEGTCCLRESICLLRTNSKEAAAKAFLARKAENRFVKAYRKAMSELLDEDDIKHILRVKEVYKQMSVGSERIDRVGECLQHIIVKMS